MSLPRARLVHGGEQRPHVGGEIPKEALRLAPRALPRGLVWRLWFGNPIAQFGWMFAALSMMFCLIFASLSMPSNAWWGWMVAVFSLVGIAIAVYQVREGRRNARLLRFGVETHGTLINKAKTSVYLNEVPVMALTFRYTIRNGETHEATVRTLTPDVLEDDATERMLYDPYAPEHATTVDTLPGSPTISADGEIQFRPGFAAHVLILPLATIAQVIALLVVLTVR